MAQYKVPQDVEADDKLLGPFSFRQFIYLMIAGGLITAAVGLFQIFPLLALIPLPVVLFFLALALPLKKDQPMETYLAALVSFYLKPRKRFWIPGQRESTITITAPKIIEKPRTRDITEQEAGNRLSFLANIVDTEGQAIKNPASNFVQEEITAEANNAPDIFDNINTANLNQMIDQETIDNHADAIKKMRQAIDKAEAISGTPTIERYDNKKSSHTEKTQQDVIVQPDSPKKTPINSKNISTNDVKPGIIELANNSDFSVETIQKQANRINENLKDEVYISLH